MQKNSVLAAMCGVAAMAALDLSVVNVALPSIQSDLHAAPADLQWVVVIYGVVRAGLLMLGGRTGDLADRLKRASPRRSSPAPHCASDRCWLPTSPPR